MTQRYAGMLRRHAADWDKREMPVQAECCRQAARHMEENELDLLAEIAALRKDAERYRFLRAVDSIPISHEAARDPVVYDAAIDAAMSARMSSASA